MPASKKERTESHEKLIQVAKALGWRGFYTMSEADLKKKLDSCADVEEEAAEEEVIEEEVVEETDWTPPPASKRGEPKSEERVRYEKRVTELLYKAKSMQAGLGMRDRKYLEFVMAYRDIIPSEYAKITLLIEELYR
jgi:hypothetical protein